jgi:glycosyl transferase family 25
MQNIIKVISLERSTERRAAFKEQNRHIDFEFFNAVDGSLVANRTADFPELFNPGLPYSAGAYGCALSHLALWQQATDSGNAVTILEDDAIVRFDFAQQSARILADAPPDWDLIVWAWNFDSVLSLNLMPGVSHTTMLFDQQQLRTAIDAFQQQADAPRLFGLDKCFGTPAYSISPRGAAKFIANCFPLANFDVFFPVLNGRFPNNGIDIAMNRIYSSTNSFCSLPPLAVTKNEAARSTVQNQSPWDKPISVNLHG